MLFLCSIVEPVEGLMGVCTHGVKVGLAAKGLSESCVETGAFESRISTSGLPEAMWVWSSFLPSCQQLAAGVTVRTRLPFDTVVEFHSFAAAASETCQDRRMYHHGDTHRAPAHCRTISVSEARDCFLLLRKTCKGDPARRQRPLPLTALALPSSRTKRGRGCTCRLVQCGETQCCRPSTTSHSLCAQKLVLEKPHAHT